MVFAKGSPRVALKRRDIIYSDELPIVEENPRERQFKPTFTTAVLLNMFTRQGDLVLDPFAGYGSIPLVAELFGRRWMGVEIPFAGYGSIPLVAELFGRRWVGIEIDPAKFEVAKRIISKRKVVDVKKLKETLTGGTGKHTPITSFMK
jgi:DNA modification methylase